MCLRALAGQIAGSVPIRTISSVPAPRRQVRGTRMQRAPVAAQLVSNCWRASPAGRCSAGNSRPWMSRQGRKLPPRPPNPHKAACERDDRRVARQQRRRPPAARGVAPPIDEAADDARSLRRSGRHLRSDTPRPAAASARCLQRRVACGPLRHRWHAGGRRRLARLGVVGGVRLTSPRPAARARIRSGRSRAVRSSWRGPRRCPA